VDILNLNPKIKNNVLFLSEKVDFNSLCSSPQMGVAANAIGIEMKSHAVASRVR
jgi:hypothetical protein